MASFAIDFSKKGSFIIACFCLQFLSSSCSPVGRIEDHEDMSDLSKFLSEFRFLDNIIDRQKCDMDYQSSFFQLMRKVWDFRRPSPTGESRKVQAYFYNAVSNREYNLRENYEGYLIENVTDYLDSVKNDMDTLRGSSNTTTKLEVLNKYRELYKLGIEDSMKESNNLIENFIKKKLEKMEYDLRCEIDSLVAQIIELYDTENEKKGLAEKEKMLERALVQRELLTSVHLVGNVMSFLSGSVVYAALNFGRGSSSYRTRWGSFYPHSSHCTWKQNSTLELMQISSELEILEEKSRSVLQPNIQTFSEVLNSSYDAAMVLPHKFGNVLLKILEVKQKLTTGTLNYQDFQNLEDVLKEELDKNKSTNEAEDSNGSDQNVENTLRKLKRIILLGNSFFEILQNFGDGTSDLPPGENLNYQNETILEIMKKYESGIQGKVDEIVSEIKKDVEERKKDQKGDPEMRIGGSACSLSVSMWQTQIFLKETKKSLSEMTDSFNVEGELYYLLEGVQETLTTLIENYDHIQNYLEQKVLFRYIEDLIDNGIEDIKIMNPQLHGTVDKLELSIRSNIVLQKYRTAIDAFKQFVFPFASLYLGGLPKFNLNDPDALTKAVSQIESVQSKLTLYEQSVSNTTNHIVKQVFNGDHYSTPFYEWENNDHRSAIRDLLSGKEVLLKADISGSPNGMDALKFDTISLELKTKNRDLQGNFTEELKNFKLRGVHLGNSYYRYDSKVYLISTKSREFDFPFEMQGMSGYMMLSPYASWKFTLVNMTDEADFGELAKYFEEVDLELVGTGFYVEHNNVDLDVDKYYKPVDYNGDKGCHLY